METEDIAYKGYQLTVIAKPPEWQVNIHPEMPGRHPLPWHERDVVSVFDRDKAIAEAKRRVDNHLALSNPPLPPG